MQRNIIDEYSELMILWSIHNQVANLAKARLNEIEQELIPEARSGDLVIDNSVVKYRRKVITSFSYSSLWRHALKIVPEETVLELNAYKDSVQRKHIHESVEIIDGRTVKTLAGLRKLPLEEILLALKMSAL